MAHSRRHSLPAIEPRHWLWLACMGAAAVVSLFGAEVAARLAALQPLEPFGTTVRGF